MSEWWENPNRDTSNIIDWNTLMAQSGPGGGSGLGDKWGGGNADMMGAFNQMSTQNTGNNGMPGSNVFGGGFDPSSSAGGGLTPGQTYGGGVGGGNAGDPGFFASLGNWYNKPSTQGAFQMGGDAFKAWNAFSSMRNSRAATKLAKKQHNMMSEMWNTNINNQIADSNRRLENSWRDNASMGDDRGYATLEDYINKHGFKRSDHKNQAIAVA